MISQTTEYALRAVVYLADGGSDTPQTAEAIAKVTKVPVGYLVKVMQGLSRAGIVTSQRGVNGGFVLQEDPKHLTVYAVVRAVAPITRITECPLGLENHGSNLCPLHRGLDNVMLAVETAFRRMTIHQLLHQPRTSRPLCRFPRHEATD